MSTPAQDAAEAARTTRRQFLVGAGVVAGGLVVGFYVADKRAAAASAAPGAAFVPNAFVHVAPDDTVTVTIGKSEMGQGVYTSLPQILAEELDIDPQRVKVQFGGVDPAFFHPHIPMQFTGGSMSVVTTYEQMRRAGATARAMLVTAAAQRWQVDAGQLSTNDGNVVHGGRRLTYGELADAASKLSPPKDVKLKDRKDFRWIGKVQRRLDGPAKVTGRAEFGLDVRRPGMLYAMIAHGPVFGARVAGFDDKAAREIPGVVDVKQVPTGVVVYATNTWAARRGRDALQVQWDLGPGAKLSTEGLRAQYRSLVAKPGQVVAKNGDVDAALGSAKKVVEAEYELPYLAHACMEPLNVCVEVQPDKVEIWTGTQGQSEARRFVAEDLGLKPEQVFVHTTFLGGGFGRRANPVGDNVREAAQIAKAMPGKPVLTVWTREDDTKAGWFRPFVVHRVRGALGEDGTPVAWLHRVAVQSIMQGSPLEPMTKKIGFDPTSVEGVSDMAYVVPNRRVELHTVTNPVPIQYWRSVGHSHSGFAVNTFVDELAVAAGKDPVDVRRAMLADKPRHRAVLEKVVEKSGWGSALPAGRARGVALHESFGSIVAQVAEVSLENGEPRVHRVVCAVDCGFPINPDNIAAQMESAIVYGLSAALRGEITLVEGRVQQQNFDTYNPLRINEMPVVETYIVETGGPLGGIGEPGTPPIAPAVCNALFALTGKRIRRLPISASLKA